MKKLGGIRLMTGLMTAASLGLLSSGCIDCVRGSGPVVREERLVEAFDKVHLAGSAHVFLTPGPEHRVSVEAQENLVPLYETEVKGGELHIRSRQCYWSGDDVYIFVMTPSLSGVAISGSGSMESDEVFRVDEFDASISGSGSILMQLVAEHVKTRIAGSGDIRLEGRAYALESRISGSGDLRAYEMAVEEATVKISGSGDARVYVTRQLEATVAGSGDIIYRGDPELRFSVSGSGSVRKAP